MWEPMAKALGYPRKPLGFDDILELARSKAGWADYGLPEFGAFKLVHTNPDYSTSGLSAVVAEYYAATGKKEGLRPEDITGEARETVKAIERSIVHYGDITLFIADQMRKGGLGYASAVAMEEATLLDFNAKRGESAQARGDLPRRRARSSPTARSSCSTATGSRRSSARARSRSSGSSRRRSRRGRGPRRLPPRRPRGRSRSPPITAANGVDPKQPERELGLPEPRVLALLKRTWREDRKPANVLLVLDTSGSMADEQRLENAKQGLDVFLSQVAPQDRVGLTTFSDQITPRVPVGPFKENKAGAPAHGPAADRRGRHRLLRRRRRRLRDGARPRRPRRPHQRRRAAHRRRGHRLPARRRGRRARAGRPGRLRHAGARLHHRLLCGRRGARRTRSRRSPRPRAATPTPATPRTSRPSTARSPRSSSHGRPAAVPPQRVRGRPGRQRGGQAVQRRRAGR